MPFDTLAYEVAENVCTITFNRPEKMNTWNNAVARELGEALSEANLDPAVRAVVITGAGRAFCAGADLERGGDTFAGRESAEESETNLGRNPRNVFPHEIDKPVIAAINGAAVGVGMTYPMLCDIRIAAEDAKLGFVFTRRGMMPELAAHLLVQRVVGFSNAADLLLSGRIFTGAEAASMGLVSEALPADRVCSRAQEMAREYVHTAPASVAMTKRLLWKGLDSTPSEMMKAEGPAFAWIGNQPDAAEGVMSFLEKRPAQWRLTAQDVPDEFRF